MLGLAAFAVALLAGLASGAEASGVLMRAVVSMFVCYLFGYAIGAVGVLATNEAAVRFVNEHPVDLSALNNPDKNQDDSSEPIEMATMVEASS